MEKSASDMAKEAIERARQEAAWECLEIVRGPESPQDSKEAILIGQISQRIKERFRIGVLG